MKTYKVIYLEPELASFRWQRGLYFIFKTDGDLVHLAKINPDGTPDTYYDGGYNITITGKRNKGIIPTKMTIKLTNNGNKIRKV